MSPGWKSKRQGIFPSCLTDVLSSSLHIAKAASKISSSKRSGAGFWVAVVYTRPNSDARPFPFNIRGAGRYATMATARTMASNPKVARAGIISESRCLGLAGFSLSSALAFFAATVRPPALGTRRFANRWQTLKIASNCLPTYIQRHANPLHSPATIIKIFRYALPIVGRKPADADNSH
jgi:hypothetical protein